MDDVTKTTFGVSATLERANAVRHLNTVFHDVLKLVPWSVFDRLVEEHQTDLSVRKFTTRQQFLALLFAQLGGVSSIRDLISTMESHQARLYHSGASVPARSTFADANKLRDASVFSELLEAMMKQASRGLRRKISDVLRLIDSTSLRLAGVGTEWARFSANVCGAKAHVVFDPDLGRPVYHAVSAANVNDVTPAKQMPIEAGATYVFDLGYYDFGWWAQMDAVGCRIVTRFKTNTPLVEARDLPVAKGSPVVSDRIGFLPARQAGRRRNPMQDAVREIVVFTDQGCKLRLLTNDLDAPAEEIAALYRRRWEIELFFRAMKQTLKITKFLGRSENAVRIQVAVALITFLLLSALKNIVNAQGGRKVAFLELVRLVRANLMHRKDATRLRNPPPPKPIDSRQLQLNWV